MPDCPIPPLPRWRAWGLCAGAALIAGCAAVGPDYRAPQPELPAAWSQPETAVAPATPLDADWWHRFDDPLLTSLVERALAANTDLRIARARLRVARASSAQAEAALWPGVGAYGSATRSASNGQGPSGSYGLGFDASWEIDLFGGLRRGAEAAEADAMASAATLASTRVSLTAEVARDYVLLRAYQLRIAITQANLDNQSQTLQIAEWRAQAGLVGQIDVEQARANREQTRAQLPQLQDAATQTTSALAVLLNVAPGTLAPELQDAAAIPAPRRSRWPASRRTCCAAAPTSSPPSAAWPRPPRASAWPRRRCTRR